MLQKQKQSLIKGYQNRYVVVKGNYFLWNDKKLNINDVTDTKQREKFKRHISFYLIDSCTPLHTKSNNKFEVFVSRDPKLKHKKNQERKFIFKAKTQNERDDWVKIIRQHIDHLKTINNYLEN